MVIILAAIIQAWPIGCTMHFKEVNMGNALDEFLIRFKDSSQLQTIKAAASGALRAAEPHMPRFQNTARSCEQHRREMGAKYHAQSVKQIVEEALGANPAGPLYDKLQEKSKAARQTKPGESPEAEVYAHRFMNSAEAARNRVLEDAYYLAQRPLRTALTEHLRKLEAFQGEGGDKRAGELADALVFDIRKQALTAAAHAK